MLTKREQTGRIQHANSVECGNCGASKEETRANVRRGDDVLPQVPCSGSDSCTIMLCNSCRTRCDSCGLYTCAGHLDVMPAEDGSPAELWCEICRRPDIAPQRDAVLVRAIAEQAIEDAEAIDMMLDAGCAFDEISAAFQSRAVVN